MRYALACFIALATVQAREVFVTAVRIWPSAEATRVAIEVSGPFEYKYDRLASPYRVYFDIRGAKPDIDGRRVWSRQVTDKLVSRVRVAETQPGVTRVVLELTGPVEVLPSQLTSPYRLIVEMRPGVPSSTSAAPPVPPVPTATAAITVDAVQPPPSRTELPKSESSKTSEVLKADPSKVVEVKAEAPKPTAPARKKVEAPVVEAVAVEASPKEPTPKEPAPKAAVATEPVATTGESARAESAKAARHTSTGNSSLTRALGLKLNRIVLDAGHGGHDQGTSGPKGLLEKDLVLDVTLRLGKLIEDGLGAEVIYTRTDDTFIPLEQRTAIANDKKADLFLSIHANSSPVARITGVETYYLNFSDSKEAMDLAARENAASQRSIFELQDLLQKITMHEKLDESREFAKRIQTSLYVLSSKNFPDQKNRGVKKAPFIVLIGAQMPSILAEIGFVTNPREESLLKKSDYRQKVAESLYKGISKYAESLSHFQLAQSQE